MTSCMRSVSVQKVSSPNVSKRKIVLPSARWPGLWPPFAARASSDDGATGSEASSRAQAARETARRRASVVERMTHLWWTVQRQRGERSIKAKLPQSAQFVKYLLDILQTLFQPWSNGARNPRNGANGPHPRRLVLAPFPHVENPVHGPHPHRRHRLCAHVRVRRGECAGT